MVNIPNNDAAFLSSLNITPYDTQEIAMQNPNADDFAYFDQNPGEDPFVNGTSGPVDESELESQEVAQYRAEVVGDLKTVLAEYLEFGSASDLVKIVAELL